MSKTTKKAFASSLKKFMQYKPITKITVKDIAADCEVGRKTFYYHFQDIYELLAWIYQTEAVEVLGDCRTSDTWTTGLRRIVYFVQANESFCKNAYYSIGRERAVNHIYPIICALLTEILDQQIAHQKIDLEDKLFLIDFYTYAFIGLIIKWSLSDTNDPEQFIERLIVLVESDFKGAVQQFSHKIV